LEINVNRTKSNVSFSTDGDDEDSTATTCGDEQNKRPSISLFNII